LKTECKSKQIEFQELDKRAVIGKFDGGRITSDARGLLLMELEVAEQLIKSALCMVDGRDYESPSDFFKDLL